MTDPDAPEPAPEGKPDGDDLVPISVRLGTVVPPEDPEDWTRPLTWVAAIGMLAAPAVALGWFGVAAPHDGSRVLFGTWAVALSVSVGAAAVGGTQLGRLRAFTGAVGAGLLAALVVVAAGAVTAGERQLNSASPTLAHALAAAVAGVAGAVGAGVVGALIAGQVTRLQRGVGAGMIGALVTTLVLPRLF